MGWLADFVDKVHGITKYAAPVEHVLMDNAKDSSTSLVNETGNFLSKIGGDTIIGKLGDTTQVLSQRDKDQSFGGWGSRTLVSAATYVAGGAIGDAGEAGSAAGAGGEALGAGSEVGSVGVYASDANAAAQAAAAGSEAGSVGVYASDANTAAQAAKVAQVGKGASDAGMLAKAGSAAKTYGPQAYSLASQMAQKKPDTQGPTTRPVVEMPDAQQQAEARRRKVAEQLARRGRAASIMTSEA